MRVAYVTARFPHGHGESFLIEEVRALSFHIDLFIFPMRLQTRIAWHPLNGATIVARPLFCKEIALSALREFASRPFKCLKILFTVIAADFRPHIVFRNMVVLPKSLWLASKVRELGIQHIHAHWSATTSTLAWIAASLTGIPWSFTAHRYDIEQANALRKKLTCAAFARAVTRRGYEQLARTEPKAKLRLLPMGVEVPPTVCEPDVHPALRILVPANLVKVKGHKYFFNALYSLRNSGLIASCELAGDGSEGPKLERLSKDLRLQNTVFFLGAVPHADIIDRYRSGLVDVVVLPSIITESGEQEGIPVALMEAMAFSVPVVSTFTGSIAELVADVGILVPPRDSGALRDAILQLTDPTTRRHLGLRGREQVAKLFNVANIASRLANYFCETAQR